MAAERRRSGDTPPYLIFLQQDAEHPAERSGRTPEERVADAENRSNLCGLMGQYADDLFRRLCFEKLGAYGGVVQDLGEGGK